MKIDIIGLGGIGSEVCEKLSKFLYYENLTCEILLVDGDEYEGKNLKRQNFKSYGNKAEIKRLELSEIYGSNKDDLYFRAFPNFIDQMNIDSVITDGDFVFLGVDNHKTRKIVSEHCSKLKNVTLISGGNELLDGNVQLYIRKDGKDVTANLTDYHPEIKNPADKLPNEMSCEELQNSAPQILFTNAMGALIMCCVFYNIVHNTLNDYGEIYFDITSLKMDSKKRNPKKN